MSTSPFVKRKIMCPMCGRESTQHSLPPNLFSIEEKESDQHPIKLKWYNPDFQNIKPHHYALFHCQLCNFTDFEESFCNSNTIANFQNLKKLLFEKNPTKEKILKFLNGRINYDNMTYESTLFLHLSAIYIYDLETKPNFRDYKKLSRLYHRLAWIYREQNPSKTIRSEDALVKEITLAINAFENQSKEFFRKYQPLHDCIKRRVLDLGVNFDDSKNPYLLTLTNLSKNLSDISKYISDIRQISQKDASLIKDGGQSSVDTVSDDNLSKLARVWTSFPIDERSALTKAIECYEILYSKITATDSIGQQLGLLTILSDLFVRVEDFEKANEYINSLYKFCTDSRQQLYQRQRNDPTSVSEAQIVKLTETITSLSDKRKEILAIKAESFRPLYEKIVETYKNEPWDVIEEHLLGSDVPSDVISHLKYASEDEETESYDDEPEKRKKFLGLF